ncbi:MAG: hypothetical protein ACIAQF_11010 [Phycisphaerales bacterium JB065]
MTSITPEQAETVVRSIERIAEAAASISFSIGFIAIIVLLAVLFGD